MDIRFSVDEIELILDSLIQGNGFKDFEKRGLLRVQEKIVSIKQEMIKILEANNDSVMFFPVLMEHVKSNENTEDVFQELAVQVKEVMDLTQKIFEKNEVIYKAMTTREFFQLNNKLSLTRKDVIEATLDIQNIASFSLLILQTVGIILSYIGYGLNEDELKTEQGKRAG
jgi:hypothetical protein